MPFMAALPAITAGAGLLGKLFGNASKGAADQRITENQQRLQQQQIQNADALQRAQLTQSDQMNRAGLDLQRKQFQQTEPSTQARQAMVGSMLARLQPLQLSGMSDRVTARMPKMNSIIDSLGPEARSAGTMLAQRGTSGLAAGPTKFDEVAPLNLPPATVMALQKSGLLEKLLGGAGLAGSIIGGLGELGNFGNKPTSGNNLPIDPYGGG